MMTPSWILDILAALMLVVAAISAARLAAGRPWRGAGGDADIDTAHLLMAIAMAGMLAGGLRALPDGVWDVIFSVMTAWFVWRVYRESRGRGARVVADSHHAPHLVHSAAMLYMFAAVSTPAAAGHGAGMTGMSGSTAMSTLGAPVVALIFALWLAAYVVLDLDRLSGPAHQHGSYFAGLAAASAGAGLAPAAAGLLADAAPAGRAVSPMAAAPAATEGSAGASPGRAAAGPGRAGAGSGRAGAAVAPARPVRTLLLSPRVAAGCRIAMGVTMAFMLVIMI
jgi:hypothetical protein